MTRLGKDTVGRYFLHEDGSLWKHVSFTDQPTACLERVDGGQLPSGAGIVAGNSRREGVVGSPLLKGFTLLVPEHEA